MTPAATSSPLLSVRDLEVQFASAEGMTPAVQGVAFDVARGEVVGLLGESGCGKSVTSLSIMRLIDDPPGRITSGEIRFEGRDLLRLSESEMQQVRGGRIAMVFQEPATSLDPAFTVGEQIAATHRRHRGGTRREAWSRAIEMMDLVGIPRAAQRAKDYPHMFSGGMRQRVAIAIGVCCEPSLLIADEPTSALDVTIQAQVLDLLRDVQSRMGMAIVFVSHDLAVVSQMCDRVVVMYAGQVVERAPTQTLFHEPKHPYTSGLLDSTPSEHLGARLRSIPGAVPPATAMPPGCRFHPRCPHARPGRCDTEPVPLLEVTGIRASRCVRVDELVLPGVPG